MPDGLPLVLTDPGLLERVLANLFANALAYSPAGQRPGLRASRSADGVLLEVIDHGRGVPDELKARMFEPFQRLDGRSGDAVATAGGLTRPAARASASGWRWSRGFLDTMGGTVAAADTPGGGLTMRVTLPCAAASAPSVTAGP